jgi:hypothetical protein
MIARSAPSGKVIRTWELNIDPMADRAPVVPYLLDMSRILSIQLFAVLATVLAAGESVSVTIQDLETGTTIAGPFVIDSTFAPNRLITIPVDPVFDVVAPEETVAMGITLDYTAGGGPTGTAAWFGLVAEGVAPQPSSIGV